MLFNINYGGHPFKFLVYKNIIILIIFVLSLLIIIKCL